MNRRDITQILEIIDTALPDVYKNVDIDKTINLWSIMFVDEDTEVVLEAVKYLIKSRGSEYKPVNLIGEINELMLKITSPPRMTEIEAWNIVKKAIRNSGYNSVDEFEKLPKQIKKLVGSPNQLKEWSMQELDTLDSVIGSNFNRSYRAKMVQVKEEKLLPESAKKMIAELSDKFKMIE